MAMVEPLSPLAEGKEDDLPLDRRLSRLFAAVPEPKPLAEISRQRVALRLRTRAPRSMRLMLVRLVAVGVVIGIAGAAAAQWTVVHWFSPQERLVARAAPASPLVPRLRSRPSLPRALPTAVDSEPEPVEAEARVDPLPMAAFPATPASAGSSRLGQEAASLSAALSALKAGGRDNASHALSAIDQHLQRFPGGALELEARVARVDALLVLGSRQEARRELSALPIESVGRKHELRLIRAELRADDDCRAALNDFQVLVDQQLPAAWSERALFGRGACLLKLGNQAAAERDFRRYLERFPEGRFAGQIRAQERR